MNNGPRRPPGTIGDMQSNIASQAAQSEFSKLQSINDKRTSDLQEQIQTLMNVVTKLSNKSK